MTRKTISHALGGISQRHIEEAADFSLDTKPMRRSLSWKTIAAAAACIALLAVAVLPLFPGNPSSSPLILTAYAVDADGGLTPTEMEKNGTPVVLSKIKLAESFNGFLFSLPSLDSGEKSQVVYVSSAETPSLSTDVWNNLIEETGLLYFYYIPSEGDKLPVSFTLYVPLENGTQLDYVIRIEESAQGYIAIQENASIQTVGGFDGPQSIITTSKMSQHSLDT